LVVPVAWGKGTGVESISFRGNDQVSGSKLKLAINTRTKPWYSFFGSLPPYDEETFLMDLLRIEKFYHQEGYLEARVTDYKVTFNDASDKVKIVIHIDEGEPTLVEAVKLYLTPGAAHGFTAKKLQGRMRLKPRKRYREEDLKLDYQKILERFSNAGYPYVEAKVKPRINRQTHRANLEWLLKPGPFCQFGPISYTGNNHVSDNAIRRGLGFSEGQRFEQKKLVNAQTQVYRLELFQFVSLKVANLEEQPVAIPVDVRVKEATLRTLKFGLGYGSEEAFRAFAQWRHRNFLGGARILRLSAKHSTDLLPLQLELELSQPYFLSNRNDLIVKPFFIWRDEKAFEVRRIGAEATLSRRLTRRTNAFFTVSIERDTVEVKGTGVAPELQNLYNKGILRAGLTHNSSDQIFTPSRGGRSSVSIEEAGRFLRTPFKFIKLSAEHRQYFRLSRRSVLATKIRVGSMKPTRGSRETPIEERFFSGGSFSVRGWGRQRLGPSDSTGVPLGGDSVLEGSFEWRPTLFKKFSAAMFLDYGNVWRDWNGFDLTDLHYAVGAGLRYDTLVGPLRIDFGWKVNKQEEDRDNYEIHFSIGQAF